MSDEDKLDMLEGKLDISSLEAAVGVWRDNGMPDYAHGKTETYAEEKIKLKYDKVLSERKTEKRLSYVKPFVDYRIVD